VSNAEVSKKLYAGDSRAGLNANMFMLFSVYSGNGKLASWAAIVGFLVMMSLDVGLG